MMMDIQLLYISRFFTKAIAFVLLTFSFGANARTIGPEPFRRQSADKYIYKVYGASAPGSGLIVQLPDSNLALITAEHVIAGMGDEEEIEIVVNDKKSLFIERKNSIKMPGSDLAFIVLDKEVLENDTGLDYYITSIETDNVLVGQDVTVAGYPVSSSSIVDQVRISPGTIQTLGSNTVKDGYSLGYSSKTYVGMSGGGVFSIDGNLIGIHGRGEAIQSGDVNKTGTNYAVLLRDALKYYRGTINESDTDLFTNATRSLNNGDFKKAFSAWKKISSLYPESFIARYNRRCLESIVNGTRIDKSEFPSIFTPSFNTSLQEGQRLDQRKGFLYKYKTDVIVKELTDKSDAVSLDPMNSLQKSLGSMGGGMLPPSLGRMSGFSMPQIPSMGSAMPGMDGMSSGSYMTDIIYRSKTSNWLRVMQMDNEPYFERKAISGDDPGRCLIFVTHSASQSMHPPLSLETDVLPKWAP